MKWVLLKYIGILIICFYTNAMAQDKVDAYGSVYHLKEDILTKKEASENYLYQCIECGELYDYDITDPFNILAFYKNNGIVIILDNKLVEKKRIPLNEINFFDPILISFSDEESFWVYDQSLKQLIKYNHQTNSKTNSSLILPIAKEIKPILLTSDFTHLALLLSNDSILILSNLGNVELWHHHNHVKSIAFYNDQLLLLDKSYLYKLKLSTPFTKTKILELKNNGNSFYITNDKVYVIDKANGKHEMYKLE